MKKHLVYLVLLSGLMLLPAQAQEAPRPRTLVRAWLASQVERGGDIGRVELHERAEWTVDGPFGVRHIVCGSTRALNLALPAVLRRCKSTESTARNWLISCGRISTS